MNKERNPSKWLSAGLLAVALLGLAGCIAQPIAREESYPKQITGQPSTEHYPPVAAGFQRWHTHSYRPGDKDLSIGYHFSQPQLQVVATLYHLEAAPWKATLDEQFDAETAGLKQAHPGAEWIETSAVTFATPSGERKGKRGTLSYRERFARVQQPVCSELMLFREGDKYIKLRCTAPVLQRTPASEKCSELMRSINWPRWP
ncbi:hypothetical protein [Hydrogenophaga sp. 5NK40-0174]|uniref:hypothetical protein n=1 Tax=Hydrogenophaga sp. 5NK40-0174 TaxID=3127649 RepID=UPI00310BEADD